MDAALRPLLRELDTTSGSCLWVADDSHTDVIPSLARHRQLTLLTNRLEIARDAQRAEIDARFSDFNFSPFTTEQLSAVFFRACKEKPVAHHVINRAYDVLADGGTLVLCGRKNEGIKTLFQRANTLFGDVAKLRKDGDCYWAVLRKARCSEPVNYLADNDYGSLRQIHIGSFSFWSKPGTYGWDKVDKGSEFLMAQRQAILTRCAHPPRHLLDLGCGYGYLAMQCSDLALNTVTATDSNAAALRCARANLADMSASTTVMADDCGETLAGPFDLILCNPPFHRGFAVAGDLTDKFLSNAARLLAPGGIAGFVVNGFIPVEKKATSYFSDVAVLADNKQFKVIAVSKA